MRTRIDEEELRRLCNGSRTIQEIADILGSSHSGTKKAISRLKLPTRPTGPPTGERNPSFAGGRKIDHDCYVLVTAPLGHPHARTRVTRKYGVILEHRLVLEKKIGRYLEPHEVVDHIDELTLHNHPDNLRLFEDNSAHLRATISGKKHSVSVLGLSKNPRSTAPPLTDLPVDTYGLRKKRGDVRLRGILLAALKFGIDSPFLLGSHRHLEKAEIDYSSRSSLELALQALNHRYEQDLIRSE